MARVAMQMYTVRNYGRDLDERLALLKRSGYSYVEIGVGKDSAATVKLLDKYGITPVSSSVSFQSWDSETDAEDHFSFLDHYKARGSMNGFFHSESKEEWISAAKQLEVIAAEFAARGFSLEYHNHEHEYRLDFDGQNALDVLFEHAPSLKYEMDIGWVTAGGADPVTMMERYESRLSAIHVKDLPGDYIRGSGAIMPDLGSGETPIPEAVAKALELGITDFIVENDEPADIEAFCEHSYRYLSDLLH